MEAKLAKSLSEQYGHLLSSIERKFARLRWGFKREAPKRPIEIEALLQLKSDELFHLEQSVIQKLSTFFREYTCASSTAKECPEVHSSPQQPLKQKITDPNPKRLSKYSLPLSNPI